MQGFRKIGSHLSIILTENGLFLFLNGGPIKTTIEVAALLHDFEFKIERTALGMSLIAPMALINVIGNSLAALDKVRNQKILQKVKRDWDSYPIFCD